jgi:uncharacterized membrane protein
MFANLRRGHIRRQSAAQDENRVLIPVLAAPIFAELHTPGGGANRDPYALVLALVTSLLSWIHTIFALHCPHEYYGQRHTGGGLEFPGREKAGYWDFI